MKKLVSVLSAAAVAVSMFTPAAFAESTDSTMKSVLVSVKERVEIPAEYTEFSSETQERYGITEYVFSWNTSDGDKSINVECYENGVISSYYGYGAYDYSNSPSIPSVSKAEAKENAEKFIKQLNPDFPYEIRIEDNYNGSLYDGGYSFDTQVYVNGIYFEDGNGSVGVNGETGEITYCTIGYTPVEFPSVEDAISVEDAEKAYSEKLGLEMVYATFTDEDGNDIAYPVYVQKYNYGKYINALTGEVEDLTGKFKLYAPTAGGTAETMSADNGLTEQEINELDNISGLISKTDIEKQLRNNKTLDIPKSANVDFINLAKLYNKDIYTYSINMSDKEQNTHIYIYVNAKTGEILSYSRYDRERGDKTATQNDKTFSVLAGDKAKEYKYDEDTQSYIRYVNGIKVQNDIGYISYSGDVLTEYRISYTDAEFPSFDNAMSKEDAEKIMFDRDGYEMVYITQILDNSVEIVPVYKHNAVSINPFTGKYVDYQNEEITNEENKLEYSDISGHYAEKYINELAYYGIGFEGGEFRPDEKITQKDFLSLLTSVYQHGIVVLRNDKEQADYVYGSSVRSGIISEEERNDEAAVTRENAAVYMIRAMGAEEYAKYNDIYVPPFNDVMENKGYIALLSAMGVVSGDGSGNFNPNHEITRAESVVMIYNYLTR